MKFRHVLIACSILGLVVPIALAGDPTPDDGKLRIIFFGAHPDDCEFRAGGTAIKWAKQGARCKARLATCILHLALTKWTKQDARCKARSASCILHFALMKWTLLVAPGNPWWLLMAPGGSWELPVAPRAPWEFLEATGKSW